MIPAGAAVRRRGAAQLGKVLPGRAPLRGFLLVRFGAAPPVLVRAAALVYVARRFATAAIWQASAAPVSKSASQHFAD
jgi:hypothetical protein